MCGFVGFVDFTKKSTKTDLENMCNIIAHRGPDAAGYIIEESEGYTIGLGHRRLSIIDLHEHANQPMRYKQWTLVYNGELYNYKEIKIELEKLGHSFKTESDTEVILHAFEQWGNQCVDRFIGMFAFIILDLQTQEIITIRDRPGVKPLHIYKGKDIIMWASEIKSFHEHPLFYKTLNFSSLKSYLQLGHVPTPHSIFENVYKQEPATIIKYDITSKQEEKIKYWDINRFYAQPSLNVSYDEAKSEIKEILTSACKYRMVSDVPVGVFLSGGYDSTLVASILQNSANTKIKTYTIGVDDHKINEAQFAKEIANRLGTDHTETYIDNREMLSLIDKLPFYYDEPFGDSSAIPTMLVSKIAKEHVTVALSADGGDEVFAGYNRYDQISRLKKIRTLSKIPFIKSIIKRVVKNPFNQHRIIDLIDNPTAVNLAKQLNNVYYHDQINQLFKHAFDDNKIDDLGLDINPKNDLKSMLAFDYQTYLLDDILVKVDRATMAFSLEGREPLLDHRIIEYAARLPNEFKIKDGLKKFILRDIVHDYIPSEMMNRPKMGFAAPVDQWLRHDLKDKLAYYFSKPFIEEQNIFNYKTINQIKDDYLNGKTKYPAKLWYILVFQMWYDKWMR